MVFIIALLILILGFAALLSLDIKVGKRALSVYSRMVLAYLKSAQMLFWEYAEAVISITLILFAYSNHFVIDYYIIFLFSSMILISFHTIKITRYPSVIF